MMSISQAVITGGTFTLHDDRRTHSHDAGFTRLQKAVAHGAFHNSGERFDPPRCHPNTRVAVIRKIMNWILGQDPNTRNAYIMWLHGPAGAGKSAIAQSIAELCYAEGRLAASFFFGRSDPNRNHARSFIATLAYQVALALPQFRQELDAAVEHDPLILTRSLFDQFVSLIATPLQELLRLQSIQGSDLPQVIVVDGLDECLDRKAQRKILDVIIRGVREFRLPFVFLIACRPEIEISTRFNSADVDDILSRLLLDRSYLPDHDIELYLRDKFKDIVDTHPFKRYLPSSWPSEEAIRHIVRKSSGQFIYASVVIQYVESSRHQPHRRLEIIQDLQPANGEQPFAELDALYTHLFFSVSALDEVLSIIAFHLMARASFVKSIEQLFSLEDGEISVLFCDLSSIIALRSEGTGTYFRILHASLPDYLLDQSRSGKFHIDMELHRSRLVARCLRFVGEESLTDPSVYATHRLAMNFFIDHCNEGVKSPELWRVISSFDLLHVYTQRLSFAQHFRSDSSVIWDFNRSFFPAFFSLLIRMRPHHEDAEDVFNRHQSAFDELLGGRLKAYYADVHLSFLVTLVDFYVNNEHHRSYNFVQDLAVFETDADWRQVDYLALTLLSDGSSANHGYYELVYAFLKDPRRSGDLQLDSTKYTGAAEFCLAHLTSGPVASRGDSTVDSPPASEPRLSCMEYFLDLAGESTRLAQLCERRLAELGLQGPSRSSAREKEALTRYLGRMVALE